MGRPKLALSAPGAIARGRGGDLVLVLGRPVRIDDAVEPQRAAAQLHRHAERSADDGQVEIEPEELQASDAEQEPDAFLVVAQVEVAASRNDGQRGRRERVLRTPDHIALVAP